MILSRTSLAIFKSIFHMLYDDIYMGNRMNNKISGTFSYKRGWNRMFDAICKTKTSTIDSSVYTQYSRWRKYLLTTYCTEYLLESLMARSGCMLLKTSLQCASWIFHMSCSMQDKPHRVILSRFIWISREEAWVRLIRMHCF